MEQSNLLYIQKLWNDKGAFVNLGKWIELFLAKVHFWLRHRNTILG